MQAETIEATVYDQRPEGPVPVERWGKDHWSTLAYIETRMEVHQGQPNRHQMRCDRNRHPAHAHLPGNSKYPTVLKDGVLLTDHDDWDCLDDAVAAGFLTEHGTGLYPVYRMTEAGLEITAKLHTFKTRGGNFRDFKP
jgi:hypothetical protein